jgi:hypothetical protein
MNDDALKSSFSELLTSISSINGESVHQQLQIIFSDSRDRAQIISYETMWGEVQTLVGQVQEILGTIESVPDWQLKLSDCISDYRRADIFLTGVIPNECRSGLRSVRDSFREIKSSTAQTRRKKESCILTFTNNFIFIF